jgi:cell division transport system ATP-binding protein
MIRFENVTKTYKDGSVVALNEVGLDIEKGEFVFLVGSSGSGKTTFLKLLLREELPDAGTIHALGRDIGQLSSWRVPYLRRNIGCIFQDFRLLPNKTVSENVAFALEVIGRPKTVVRSQVAQVLELVGLGEKGNRLPEELSGGEQQRVAVARAFVNRPLVLLADEPTGNLDPATSLGIMKLLDRINRTGTTVLMATHDVSIVDAMRRRVIELDRGHVVRDQRRGVYGYGDELPSSSRGVPAVAVGVGMGLRMGDGRMADGRIGEGRAGEGRIAAGRAGDVRGRDAFNGDGDEQWSAGRVAAVRARRGMR